MTVKVRFPDGSVSQVPGELREMRLQEDGRWVLRFEQVPINCHPHWRYIRLGRMWIAQPRKGSGISLLTPRSQAWWQAIPLMIDDRPEPPASAAA